MKKIAIIVAVLLALLGGTWLVLTSFIINSKEIAGELQAVLESATGRTVHISGDGAVSLFPVPQVAFGGMRVSNVEGASSPQLMTVKHVVMKLDMAQLMTGKAKPSEIRLEEAQINLEVLPGGRKNWHFGGEARQSDSFRNYFLDAPVLLDKSALVYVNAVTGSHSEVSGISGTLAYKEGGDIIEYNGAVDLHGQTAQLMVRMRSTDITAGNAEASPFQFVIKHQGAQFKAQGNLSTADSEPEFIGRIEVTAGSVWNMLGVFTGGGTPSNAGEFTLQGDMTLSTRHVRLTGVQVDGGGAGPIPALKGKMDMEYRFGKTPYIRLQPHFETVDMDVLVQSYLAWATGDELPNLQGGGTGITPYETFLRVASGAVNVTIDSLIFQGRSINNIRFSSTLQPRNMSIREGFANMPGETRMTFAGVVTSHDGLAFNGKFEMQGRKLEQFMSLFTSQDGEFPPLDLGVFGVRTNVAINSEQVRFSEFQARIADTLMAGAIVLQQGDRPKLESYLRIANTNLDVISKAIAFMLPEDEGVRASGSTDVGFDVQYLNTRFNWLNAVGFDVDSNFLLQDFVLFDRKGQRAEFNLRMGLGSIAFNRINANYNGATITGSYGMLVEQRKNPYVQVDTTISELNMVDIFPDLAHTRNDDEWEAYLAEPLEMMLLQTYRADIKARVGKLHIRDYTFEKVDTEMHLADGQLAINKFTGYLWDGGVNARAAIQAGTIPSLSLAFALENVNLVRLSAATRLLKHAAGRVGSSGQLTTSGVTLRSWFTNAKGEIRVRGSDLSMQGFGISTLARAVPVARQVRDIEQARDLALRGGVTRISQLDGLINVDGGKASTPITNYTSSESKGTVIGSVNLIDETVDLEMRFHLLNTVETDRSPPELVLRLEGEIDGIKKDLDTQQLENYVSQRAAERALGRDR